MLNFKDIKYSRPDIEAFESLVRDTRLKLMSQRDPELASGVICAYEKELARINTQISLVNILHDLDTSNEFYKDEVEACDELSAKIEEMSAGVSSVLLNCPCADELRKKYGDIVFLKAQNQKDIISKEVVDLIVKESNLENEYSQLQSEAVIEFDGNTAMNVDAFERVIRMMKELGIGYGAINHPVDRDPVCGYVGVIKDVCPGCGRREGDPIPAELLKNLNFNK